MIVMDEGTLAGVLGTLDPPEARVIEEATYLTCHFPPRDSDPLPIHVPILSELGKREIVWALSYSDNLELVIAIPTASAARAYAAVCWLMGQDPLG